METPKESEPDRDAAARAGDRARGDESAPEAGAGAAHAAGVAADAGAVAAHDGAEAPATGRYLLLLSLAATGIVYGDIGTSPIYALRESFLPSHRVPPTPANVLGVLSLIFWVLVIIISVKYVTFILRADNRGSGGILALTSLVTPIGAAHRGRWLLVALGLFATGLLYGEGVITPAISVLSAVEGLEHVAPSLEEYVIPITIAILVALFAFQSRGTAGVARIFGPVMVLWFAVLGVLGVIRVAAEPAVLSAVSPHHAIRFFVENRWHSVLVLGSVALAVTGCEALYADLGHFGRRPIRLAWFALVQPALLLNYFGQGALIIGRPEAAADPFFLLVPRWALLPLVLLATAATIIASQALISGSYSLTMQAVQLGYVPRVSIEHTSAEERGQIFIPAINRLFMIACIGLVLGFRTSSNIAAAYGVSVTTTMVVTSVMFFVVVRERWKWRLPVAILAGGAFLMVNVPLWSANLLKIPAGGWFSLLAGAFVFTLLTTWKRGRAILAQRIRDRTLPRELFIEEVTNKPPIRVPGTAVYMYSSPEGTPPALLRNLKHNKVLHERVVFLTVETEEVPFVPPAERATVEHLAHDIYHIALHYGFMESADVPRALVAIQHDDLRFKPMETTYFLGHETLIASRRRPGMSVWREKLFALMSRNATNAASFFRLPPNRVVQLGALIEL